MGSDGNFSPGTPPLLPIILSLNQVTRVILKLFSKWNVVIFFFFFFQVQSRDSSRIPCPLDRGKSASILSGAGSMAFRPSHQSKNIQYWPLTIDFTQTHFFFFLDFLKLEKPLKPEMCSLIRTLARLCATLRSRLPSAEDALLPQLNLFICLVGRYFDQTDLADA